MIKGLQDFINEAAVGAANQYSASVKIVRFLEKKIGQTYVDFDGQNYTNNEGNYFGYLFVSNSDTSAIRVNWEGNVFHSINFWQDWNYNVDPTLEIKTGKIAPGNSSFARLLPEIADIIAKNNAFEDGDAADEEPAEDIDESTLDEAAKFQYGGQIYNGKQAVVRKMYDEGKDLEDIKATVQLNGKYVKSIIAKYIKNQGGSVSEVAEALGVSNIEARELCGEHFDDEGNESYNPAIKILDGAKETIVPSKQLKAAQEELNETEYADPDLVFDELSDYVTLIAKGVMPALLVTGQGGIGKSYNIDKILDQYGKRHETWEKIKGKASPAAMYATLWYNRDKIVVFDDCDSVFKDPDALNILKGALDNNDFREISWATKSEGMVYTTDLDDNKEIAERVQEWKDAHNGKEGFPNHFIFEGEVIFISNMKKSEIYKKDSALLTRCTCIDIVLSAQGVMKRMETVLPHIKIYKSLGARGSEGKDITNEELKKEVFDFMKSDEFLKNPKRRGRDISFRTLDQIYKLRWAGLENWKERAYNCGG